jgi:hypothetical protein
MILQETCGALVQNPTVLITTLFIQVTHYFVILTRTGYSAGKRASSVTIYSARTIRKSQC